MLPSKFTDTVYMSNVLEKNQALQKMAAYINSSEYKNTLLTEKRNFVAQEKDLQATQNMRASANARLDDRK